MAPPGSVLPSDYVAQVQRRLRDWRLFFGLSQDALAKRLNVSVSTISGWENVTRTVSLSVLQKLGDAYGVSPAFLIMIRYGPPERVMRFQRIAEVMRELDQEKAEQWLALGEDLAGLPQRDNSDT